MFTQITQIYTDLVATREIIKLTQKAQNWRQAECRMSSLIFCWGAKEEDDSQTTEIIKLTQITQIYTDLFWTTNCSNNTNLYMVASLKIETKIKNENKIGKI